MEHLIGTAELAFAESKCRHNSGRRIVKYFTLPHGAFTSGLYPGLSHSAELILARLYAGPSPERLITKNNPKSKRNAEICRLYESGWSVPKIAAKYGISKARVYEILDSRK